MKLTLSILLLGLSMTMTALSQVTEAADKLTNDSLPVTTARAAYLNMHNGALDLLDADTRRDMIDYLDADTVRSVPNALGGLSHIVRPVNDSYLKVQITPASIVCFKILPTSKTPITAVAYTINDGRAADTQVSFYDNMMRPLKTDKYLKLARIEDFLKLPDHSKELKKELLDIVPFPTVEYTLSPTDLTLTARLTVGEFMSIEDYQKLEKYLRPELIYRWDGRHFRLDR